MGSLSNFSEAELLDHVYNVAYSATPTLSLALASADPGDAATGASMNELANANGYARTTITFGAAGSRLITQNADVDFPQATGGGWGTASHWAVLDNSSYGLGNVLASGAFAVAKLINDGNTPTVASAEVYVQIDANEISDYLALNWLDLMFRNQVFAKPATYVGLTTVIITDGMTGTTITEPSGGAYARKQVNINGGASPTWDIAVEADPSYVDNTHIITFITATASWGTIVGVAICDAATVGELLMYDNGMTDQLVDNGDTAEFAAAALVAQQS